MHLLLIALAAIPTDVSANVTVQSSGYTYRGGAVTQLFLAPGASTQLRFNRLLIDAGAVGIIPLTGNGAAGGAAAVLRLGDHWERLSFSLGVNLRLDATPAPFLPLPSAVVAFRFTPNLVLRGALFDEPIGPIARLSLAWRGFGIGYLPPVGAEIFGTVPFSDTISVRLGVTGETLLNTYRLGAAASFTWSFS